MRGATACVPVPRTGTPALRQIVVARIHSIQAEMLRKAEVRLASMTRECSSYDEMKQAFLAESNQGQGLWLVSASHTQRGVACCRLLSPAMQMQLADAAEAPRARRGPLALARCACCPVVVWPTR